MMMSVLLILFCTRYGLFLCVRTALSMLVSNTHASGSDGAYACALEVQYETRVLSTKTRPLPRRGQYVVSGSEPHVSRKALLVPAAEFV